jgi:hypothetical protein
MSLTGRIYLVYIRDIGWDYVSEETLLFRSGVRRGSVGLEQRYTILFDGRSVVANLLKD